MPRHGRKPKSEWKANIKKQVTAQPADGHTTMTRKSSTSKAESKVHIKNQPSAPPEGPPKGKTIAGEGFVYSWKFDVQANLARLAWIVSYPFSRLS